MTDDYCSEKGKKDVIGIISGRFPPSDFSSSVNHSLYARKYGYFYINCNWPTGSTNPYYNKLCYILEYIDLFDYVFWIDDDAFFFEFEKDIKDYLPQNRSVLSFCKSPNYKDLKTFISSGQFFVKSNELGRAFIQSALNTDLEKVKRCWKDEYGFFTKGDQDAMVYLIHTDERFRDRVDFYDYRCFNSRPENLLNKVDYHQPFILHFTGRPEIKWKNYCAVQNKFNLGATLVKNEDLSQYRLIDKASRLSWQKKFLKIVTRIIEKIN